MKPAQLLSSSLDPFVQSLANGTMAMKAGDLLSYEDAEKRAGLARSHRSFRAVIARWRRDMLTGRNIYVVCEANKGYRLCNPDEHLTQSARLKKQAARRTGKALSILMHTTDGDVSPQLRPILEHERIKTGLLLQSQRDDLTRHRRLIAVPEQLPKILGETAAR